VLDWKKVDLDAGVLQRVGGHLLEVHLQWSGNNSALRAWGGPSGLRAIQTLRKVYLYAREVCTRSRCSLPSLPSKNAYVVHRRLIPIREGQRT
jgi:hypothetical protein